MGWMYRWHVKFFASSWLSPLARTTSRIFRASERLFHMTAGTIEGEEVLTRRTDANQKDPAAGNLTPLHLAVAQSGKRDNHPDVVRNLLEHVGHNAAAASECCDATFIMKNMHWTKIITEDLHVNLGWPHTVATLLHWCAMFGTAADVDIARLLLQHGADVHRQLKIPSEH